MSKITNICLSILILGFVAESVFANLNLIDVYRKEVFNIAVLKNRKPVLVYYTSSTCNICNIVYNKIENFAQENSKTLYVAKVDFAKTPQLKQEFGIEHIPTTRAYVNGKMVQEVRGPLWPVIQAVAKGLINSS